MFNSAILCVCPSFTRGHVTCLKLSPNLRKVSRVPESSRAVEVEMDKLERVITLMKR